MKRLLSLLLAGILIFSLFPAQVLATEGDATDIVKVEGTNAPSTTPPANTKWVQQGEAFQELGTAIVCNKEVHVHGDGSSCDLKCSLDVHTHVPNCAEDCTIHAHGADCSENCALPEHTCITDGCGGDGICAIPVHSHGDGSSCQKVCIKEEHSHTDDRKEKITYTNWKLVETVTVTFDSNGGNYSGPSQIDVEVGKNIPEPEEPEDPNLIFAGWYDEKGYQWKFSSNLSNNIVTTDVTLTAQWKISVTFDTTGGKPVPNSLEVKKDSLISAPTAPSKDGYKFDGWYDDPKFNEDDKWNFSLHEVDGNTILYAKWLPKVTFDTNGGIPVPDSQHVEAGSKISNPDPTGKIQKDGCDFIGWYDKNGNIWKFEQYTVSEPITLSIKWKVPVEFVVGEDVVYDGREKVMVAEGEKVTEPIPDPTREGFRFAGWYDDNGKKWETDNTFTEPTKLHAKWEVRVDFDLCDEDATLSEPKQIWVLEGNTIPEPEDKPELTNSVFYAWYHDDNLWDFDTPVTEEITLTAGWVSPIEVTFNDGDNDNIVITGEGMPVSKPDAPSKEGYFFGGWYDESEVEWDFDSIVTKKITLTAKWNYKVTFNTGSNVSKVEDMFVTPGSSIAVADLPQPSKPGYVFSGWYKNIGLTAAWTDTDAFNESITTLYAKWQVTVTFYDKKGGNVVDIQTINPSTPVSRPKNDPVQSNKTFLGWYDANDNAWDFTKNINPSIKLYAKWEDNPLVIKVSTTTNLYAGDTPTFTVTLNGKTDSTLDINWSVSGNTDEDTDISDAGVLTIGEDEEAETLTVTAKTGTYTSDFYVTLYPTYDFKSGSGGKWAQKSTKSLTFECNGPMDKISTNGIKIGSSAVSTTNYTIEESSYGFKLTLKSAAMSSLSVAEHKLTITFDDGGKAETTFEVIKESDIPETGDFFHLPLWCMLLAVTAAAALMLKKRQA